MKQYNTDVAIIGGGSAGLAAAIEVKKANLDVLILERERELGGIALQCIHNGFGLYEFKEELTGPEYVQRFINEIKRLDISYKLNTMVIELKRDKTILAVNKDEGLIEIKPKAVILAMGCRERTRGNINLPGFRPAGIYTAGQAQRFVNMEGWLPGKTYVILGSGDIGMIMARRLVWEGCKVNAVVEIMSYVSGLLRNQVQCLEDYDIPLITGFTITKIHGRDRILGVTLSKVDRNFDRIIGSDKFIECDTLLLSVGLIPENELTLKAGAELSSNNGPVVDNNLETTIDGIFACGNVLQVHDLVDMVTVEARRAGRNAAEYVKIRWGKKRNREDRIECIPGENVNYIKPDFMSKSDIGKDIIFTLRVKMPGTRKLIQFKDHEKNIIYSKKKIHVIPSEMIEIKLNLEKININPACGRLEIEVIDRPEVLIEED